MALQISRIYLFTLPMGFIVVVMTLSHAAFAPDADFRKNIDTRASVETTARQWGPYEAKCQERRDSDIVYCDSPRVPSPMKLACRAGVTARALNCLSSC